MLLRNEDEARDFVRARCSKSSFEKLEGFVKRLKAANDTQNLVAAATLPTVWARHIADSAQLIDHVSRETGIWLDLGTGAGFPGLVVAAMDPNRRTILVESRRLRIQWLGDAVSALKLENCRVIGSDVRRIEAIGASVISARAFAPLVRLVELSARFSTNETEWVLPKGRSAEQDIAELPRDLRSKFHVKQSVTDPDAKIVVAKGKMETAA